MWRQIVPEWILGGKQLCQTNLLLFYSMPDKKHWIPCVLTLGSLLTLSLLISTKVKKAWSARICDNVCAKLFETSTQKVIISFPVKIEWYMELLCAAPCSLMITTLKALVSWEEEARCSGRQKQNSKLPCQPGEDELKWSRGKCMVLHISKLSQLHK